MSERTQTDRRIGVLSATSATTIGIIYVVVGLIGWVVAQPRSPNPLRQVDPYLAILEALIILSAVVLVIMMAAVYAYARPERKTIAVTALAFMICSAILTCGVHFASLTVGRQIDPRALPPLSHQLSVNEDWPALAISLDLLAWDLFLGLALIFAAGVFTSEASRRVRVSMTAAGTLCLAGTLGPASGHMHIQYLGIAGYAFVLPVACALLTMFLWQERSG
jgi:divalent metal cation (Fe/Co/Zn/Cd) transporter